MKNEMFIKNFMAAVEGKGIAITKAEALEHFEGNRNNAVQQTPEEFANDYIDGLDDGSEPHPARYGAS